MSTLDFQTSERASLLLDRLDEVAAEAGFDLGGEFCRVPEASQRILDILKNGLFDKKQVSRLLAHVDLLNGADVEIADRIRLELVQHASSITNTHLDKSDRNAIVTLLVQPFLDRDKLESTLSNQLESHTKNHSVWRKLIEKRLIGKASNLPLVGSTVESIALRARNGRRKRNTNRSAESARIIATSLGMGL